MGNYDLLNEEDFFSSEKPDKEQSKKEQEDNLPKEEAPEELFTDDLFDDPNQQPLSQEEFGEDQKSEHVETIDNESEDAHDFHEDIQQGLEIDQDEIKEKTPPASELKSEEDYYDDDEYSQRGINYKPILIGFFIVVFLGAITYFVLNKWVLNSGEEKEELIEEQVQPTPEETRRANYFSQLAGHTNQELSFISKIMGITNKETKLSIIFLYDKEFMFEVFSGKRDNLAKLNMNLKNVFKDKKFSVISSIQRPGKNGGVFGLYTVEINGSAPAVEVTNSFTNEQDADKWLSFLANSSKLQIKRTKNKTSPSKDDFRVIEIESNMTGNFAGCLQLIENIAKAGKNIKIHKLTCSAVDQKNFNKGKYQLKIIFKVFV
ncbi:MAG: hypothetical protein K8R79_07690 [Calditrichales bacterium]|nr:hypothetical protein [Calditrichales bacterium]